MVKILRFCSSPTPDDPGSANNGGEIGFVSRGTFVPEFEKVAFRLKKGEVSEIVKTNFG